MYSFQIVVVTDGSTTYGIVVYGLLLDDAGFTDGCDEWVSTKYYGTVNLMLV